MIRLSSEAGVARICLDRPSARNAMTVAGWDALANAAAEVGEAAVVILCSATPDAFCAGADIGELATLEHDVDARRSFREAMRAGIDAMASLDMPVIAAVDGDGVALMLAADWCIAGNYAVFAITPAKLGITYPGEDVARLCARVGRSQAARLLLSAAVIDSDESIGIGLVQARADRAAVAAAAVAENIVELARPSLRALKLALASPRRDDAAFDAMLGEAEFATRSARFAQRSTSAGNLPRDAGE